MSTFGSVSLIRVNATWELATQVPVTSGRVTFTPVTGWKDPGAMFEVLPAAYVCSVDSLGRLLGPDGQVGVLLPATDDPDVAPTGFTYSMVATFPGFAPITRSIEVPAASVNSVLNLWNVGDVPPSSGAANYVLLDTYLALVGRVTNLENEEAGGGGGLTLDASSVPHTVTGSGGAGTSVHASPADHIHPITGLAASTHDHNSAYATINHTHTGYVTVGTVVSKGDLLVASGNGVIGRLGTGGDGQVLTADSSQTLGVAWEDSTGSGGGGSTVAPHAATHGPSGADTLAGYYSQLGHAHYTSYQALAVTGQATVAADTAPPGLLIEQTFTCTGIAVYADTPPVGSPLTMQVTLAGSPIFTQSVASGQGSGSTTFGTATVVAAGSLLKFSCTAVGSSTPGSDILVVLLGTVAG